MLTVVFAVKVEVLVVVVVDVEVDVVVVVVSLVVVVVVVEVKVVSGTGHFSFQLSSGPAESSFFSSLPGDGVGAAVGGLDPVPTLPTVFAGHPTAVMVEV